MRARTRKALGTAVAFAIVVGTMLAITYGAVATPEQPTDWPGVTVYEDGSVTVDESQDSQDARSALWSEGCDWRGNGWCG